MNTAAKRALAIATVGAVTLSNAALVSAGTQRTREAEKARTPTPLVATDQDASHRTWRYFGGPKGDLWPAPGN